MHTETDIMINATLKCQRTWKLDSNKRAYNSASTNIMIQDMNKVPSCTAVVPRQVYESPFWTPESDVQKDDDHSRCAIFVGLKIGPLDSSYRV